MNEKGWTVLAAFRDMIVTCFCNSRLDFTVPVLREIVSSSTSFGGNYYFDVWAQNLVSLVKARTWSGAL
jgi:hypothetical protein